jgi:NAD(P)-dependent dehydrogenase (short-subunit alcohol dehydrogenase family)
MEETVGHTDGRVALVTGAARGMGKAIALRLHDIGTAVALNDVDPGITTGTAAEVGEDVLAVPADVTSSESVKRMVTTTLDHFGRLDILVNNAGILFPTRLEQISEKEWRRTLDVNLTGAFFCTQSVISPMKRQGYGRIVNLASTAGKTVSTLGGAHYTASKHGVLGLTRAAALELAPYGITVNAVCPGLIDTEMAHENTTPERLEAYRDSFPMGRLGRAEEVASLVCFLASEEAGYITGAAYDITGGDLMV